jgi:hypothetical protein
MQTRGCFEKFVWGIVLAGMICYSQRAKAGWTGLINGAGFGWASVNVRSVTSNSNKVTTPSISGPSATIAPTAGYAYQTNSPSGANVNTHSRIKGAAGGIWTAQTFASPGDGADNAELQARVNVVPATCATLNMDTAIDINEFNANGNSGNISVNAQATTGTALWLRGFEYTGDPHLIPADDPNTVENESIEYLKANGTWKFEMVLLGPFDHGGGTSCPLLIPFSLDSSNLNNLYFAADGVALTVPFSIQCPADVTSGCGQVVHYPPIHVSGGCGSHTLSITPPDGTPFPVGVTPVTATATDESGNTVSCGFNVKVADTQAPVPPPLPDIVSSACSGAAITPLTPVATDNCAGSVLGTTTTPFPITAAGTNIVTWRFDDGNGNVSTANQRVIITGPTITGFYSPIGGNGGTCSKAFVTVNGGSILPIKFDMLCGGSYITSGPPPVVKVQSWSNCAFTSEPVSVNAVYQNNWHFNWDTSGYAKGIYKVIVIAPGGSSQFVFVKIN